MANGLLERFHRSLKCSLRTQENPSIWAAVLPIILLQLRNAFKPDMGYTPAELVHGTALRLPAECFTSSVDEPVPYSRNYASEAAY